MSIIDLIKSKEKERITIEDTISIEDINDLKYLKNNTIINITSQGITNRDEINYLLNIKKIIDTLSTYHKNFTINIKINNREIFRQNFILSNIPKNITLTIHNDNYIYSIDEYLTEENKLETLVKPIREANLSPLEKYLIVYDIVKKFKSYKENDDSKKESRKLRYILKDDNNYIVCVGFAKLLTELLNRVNIPNQYIHVDVDNSYDKEKLQEGKNINLIGHARNIIKIDDDKYNVHGYYLADSTLDNKTNYNLYLHSLMTFDRLKEAKNLEKLTDIDLLLDFHNLEDFEKKIKYFIKQNNDHLNNNTYDCIIMTYKQLYLKIMSFLKGTDESMFIQLYEKYNAKLCDNIDNVEINELRNIIAHFITDYYRYITPLSNNNIDIMTILNAAGYARKKIYNLSKEELDMWLKQTIDDNMYCEITMFPYKYDPSNKTEAYLESRKK